MSHNSTKHPIDTQWHVNFNLSLASFEPHIAGVKNLIRLGAEHEGRGTPLRFFFTSSVGVANNINLELVPEKSLFEFVAPSSGYGDSKLIAEELISQASDAGTVRGTICRVGQIAGPVRKENSKGVWNRKEWLPSVSRICYAHDPAVESVTELNERSSLPQQLWG